jgi:hypothetical protein
MDSSKNFTDFKNIARRKSYGIFKLNVEKCNFIKTNFENNLFKQKYFIFRNS